MKIMEENFKRMEKERKILLGIELVSYVIFCLRIWFYFVYVLKCLMKVNLNIRYY